MNGNGNDSNEERRRRIEVTLRNNDTTSDDFPEECAIVRIWTSMTNIQRPGEAAGHVSLELILNQERGSWDSKTYISVGPSESPGIKPPAEFYVEKVQNNPMLEYFVYYVKNYEDDIASEGRAPEYTFVFYSLEVFTMHKAVKDLLKNFPEEDQRWTVAGPSFSLGHYKKDNSEVFADLFDWYIGRHLSYRTPKGVLTNESSFNTGPEPDDIDSLKTADKPTINVSCVSLVFQILEKANLSSQLLASHHKRSMLAYASNDASKESVEGIRHLEYQRILRGSGYLMEYGLSSLILSPDVFADLVKAAKKKDLEQNDKYELTFVNNVNQQVVVREDIPSTKKDKRVPYYLIAFTTCCAATLLAVLYKYLSSQ